MSNKKYKQFYHEESGIIFKNFDQVREYIWETREHKSELSGEPLLHKGHWQWSWQFLHLLGRNYTYWVLNPDNVILGTVKEHEIQGSIPCFVKKQDEMREKYYQESKIKKL